MLIAIDLIRKALIFIALVSFFHLTATAQTPVGEEGFQFSLGSGYTSKGIPVLASFEMGFLKNITLGVNGYYRNYSEKTDSVTYAHSIVGIGFMGNYYFNGLLNLDEDKWGLYGGINVGFYKWFSSEEALGDKNSSSTLGAGIQLGGRYYFKDFGIFLELQGGSESAGGFLGVSYRFPD